MLDNKYMEELVNAFTTLPLKKKFSFGSPES